MTADELRAELADVGARRKAAVAAKKQASHDLTTLIPRAAKAGVSPSEIARLTGLSRQGVHEFTRRQP